MRSILMAWILAALCLVGATGCSHVRSPVVPYRGIGIDEFTWSGFTNVTAPVDTTFRETAIGPRTGRATVHNVLGLISFGEAGLDAAARNGRLTQIDHIDCRIFTILGLYSFYETIVSGQ